MQKREVMQDTAADGAEADGDKARAGIQSVEVGFALLQVLAQGPGAWMLRDLAARAGMPAAKAHRYLVSFQRLGLVVQDSRTTRYDLGPAALQLGLSARARLDGVRHQTIPGRWTAAAPQRAAAVPRRHPTAGRRWRPSPG